MRANPTATASPPRPCAPSARVTTTELTMPPPSTTTLLASITATSVRRRRGGAATGASGSAITRAILAGPMAPARGDNPKRAAVDVWTQAPCGLGSRGERTGDAAHVEEVLAAADRHSPWLPAALREERAAG